MLEVADLSGAPLQRLAAPRRVPEELFLDDGERGVGQRCPPELVDLVVDRGDDVLGLLPLGDRRLDLELAGERGGALPCADVDRELSVRDEPANEPPVAPIRPAIAIK